MLFGKVVHVTAEPVADLLDDDGRGDGLAQMFLTEPLHLVADLESGDVGSDRARCRPLSRSVSLARPPNRTCDSHRIRLSTYTCRQAMRLPASASPTARGLPFPGSDSG